MNESSMTKPVGIMPSHLDLREITFTNLLLLDFNPAEMESKYRAVFNRDMFALPNKKAMEVVMHFLFTRLHPQLAYEEFRDCWPVRDKVLEQQFRKVCFSWVSRIQKEDPEARLPRIVQSLFHSPGGDRFYAFLHHFSLYVLTKVMQRDHGKMISIPTFPTKTVHNHSFTHVMSRALEAHYVVLKKRFLEFTQHAVQVEHHWKEFAMESTKEFRSLVKKKRDLERHIMELDGMIAPRGTSIGVKTDYQEDVEALKRTQQLQKVRDLWAGIAEFYTVQAPQRRIVDSVLQGEANKYHIDAADIQPRVPNMLLRDCEKEIRKRNIEDTYVGGKVNLFSLIQLWNLSLSKIKEQIYQESLPTIEDQSPAVKSALHTHHAHLTNTMALREAIEGIMPAMKESIKELKQRCYQDMEKHHSRPAETPVLFKLGLVPPTPPVSFAAADTPAAERITSFHDTLKMSPHTVSTPDVIQAWTKSARDKQLDDEQGSVTKLPKTKKAEPSRLPRPKQHFHPANQTRNATYMTSRSTLKKKKKPFTQVHAEESIPYPHYVSPRTNESKKKAEKVPLILKPQAILADQIADAMAKDESTSSFLSSSATSSRASTPKAQALEDPVGALGQGAFQPRDLIPRTPAKTESETETTSTRPRTDNKPGRLLETILDESTGTATPSPAQEKYSTETSPPADFSWSDINFTPKTLKTSLFQDSPPERDTPSARLGTIHGHTDVKRTPDLAADVGAIREPVSFSHPLIQPTPNSIKKSLFEEFPQPGESLPRKEQGTPCLPGKRQSPDSARVPPAVGPSPQLDFWLRPQDRNLDYSGIQATPTSVRSELFEGTPLENGNSPFGNFGFLSSTGDQFKPQTDKTKSVEKTSQAEPFSLLLGNTRSPSAVQPSPLRSPLARHATPEIRTLNSDHELDTTELAKRLDKIKQPSLQFDTWGLLNNTSSNNSAAKHTPKSADAALIGDTHSRHVKASREMTLDYPSIQPSPSSTQPSHVRELAPPHRIVTEQSETVVTPSGVHYTPKSATFRKETSFQNPSPSSYEVDTSALIQRLNKIKLTQQSFSTPHYTPSRPLETRAAESIHRNENGTEMGSDTSLLASRLDQIKQAQKSQQVTPGANTDGDLNTSRTSEPALLTPLTPSSRDTPSDEGTKNEVADFSFNSPQNVVSPPGSPSSPLDRNFFLQSPFKTDQAFTSPFQGTPLPASVDTDLNGGGLMLDEGLQWETATPSLPQRLTARTGLPLGEKSYVAPSLSNGLRSPALYNIATPLLVNSVQRPDRANWEPGSSQTPASLSGFGEQDGQVISPHLDLASPYSYRGNVSSHVTPLRQGVPQSPVIGQLIDLE